MEERYKKINTDIGYIEAKRTAIYLDFFKQEENTLNLIGEVSSRWCEKKSKNCQWYKYSLTMKGVKEYQAINIEDYYKKRINTESAFSEIISASNSEFDLKTIIIETYDWAYIVECTNFEFVITGAR